MELPRDACLEKVSFRGNWSLLKRPLQRGLGACPWRVAVASMLLNRTRSDQVRPVLSQLLINWPTPGDLVGCDLNELVEVLTPTGFRNRRAKTLRAFDLGWVAGEWTDLRDLPGVGPYVADAVSVFCFGCRTVVCGDRVLEEYCGIHAEGAS